MSDRMSEKEKPLPSSRLIESWRDGYRTALRDTADALEAGEKKLGWFWRAVGAGGFLLKTAADLRAQAARTRR